MVIVVAGIERAVASVVYDTGYMSLVKDTPGAKPTDRVSDKQSR